MAYCTGKRLPPRDSNSGRHGVGTLRRAASASHAANQRLAKRTSRSAITGVSANLIAASPGRAMISAMRSVTVRYTRLNTATPSSAASAASISHIRPMTPATVVGRLTS